MERIAGVFLLVVILAGCGPVTVSRPVLFERAIVMPQETWENTSDAIWVTQPIGIYEWFLERAKVAKRLEGK